MESIRDLYRTRPKQSRACTGSARCGQPVLAMIFGHLRHAVRTLICSCLVLITLVASTTPIASVRSQSMRCRCSCYRHKVL